jgi:hypothetical protein
MKHIIFYVFIAMLAVFMTYIILNNKPEQSPKLLTINTTYSYLYDENKQMEIPLFINHKDHPLNEEESYQALYLSDEFDQKRLEVSLSSIKKAHFESFLGETYQLVILVLDLPYIDGSFEIIDTYLHIGLVNQDSYEFLIGDIFINYQLSDYDALIWESLYGLKEENKFLSRLSEIHIPYQSLDKEISSISLGSNDMLSYTISDNILKIHILHQDKLLYDVPVIITYNDQSIQTINNFRYIIDYQLLKESGPLVNIYALN